MERPTPDTIRFRNRHSGQLEAEAVYGERWLRWVYDTPTGRLAAWLVARRAWFSRWYGWRMNQPASRQRIRPFIDSYQIDSSEMVDSPESFPSFNAFFYRRLRPEARPIDPTPDTAVFPADGRHLGFPDLSAARAFFVKGQTFDLPAFLGDDALLRRYAGGPAVFSRLCPVDYHRFHFPLAGVPAPPRLIDGWLWSVNPIALRRNLGFLWQNRRWLAEIHTAEAGEVLMVEIGATNVGSAVHTYAPHQPAAKGAEKGYFRFGGSAVMTLFQPGSVRLADDLLAASAEGLELYARMGSVMATVSRR